MIDNYFIRGSSNPDTDSQTGRSTSLIISSFEVRPSCEAPDSSEVMTEYITSKFFFVDLAGSERVKKVTKCSRGKKMTKQLQKMTNFAHVQNVVRLCIC